MRTAAEISREIPEFLKFRYVSGFGEAFMPPNLVGDTLDGFKGWEKDGGKTSPGNKKRILKLLQKSLGPGDPETVSCGFGQRDGDLNEDQPGIETRADMILDFRTFGMICSSVDFIFRRSFTGLREIPAHVGVTMYDEAVAVMDVLPSIGPKECREGFIKTVMISLLRERSIPLYLTDLTTRALRIYANKNRRGYPIVTYENVALNSLFGDIKECRGQGIPSVTEKLKRIRSFVCPCPIGTPPPKVRSNEPMTPDVGGAAKDESSSIETSPVAHAKKRGRPPLKNKDPLPSSTPSAAPFATGTVLKTESPRQTKKKSRASCPSETQTKSPQVDSADLNSGKKLRLALPNMAAAVQSTPVSQPAVEESDCSTESDDANEYEEINRGPPIPSPSLDDDETDSSEYDAPTESPAKKASGPVVKGSTRGSR